jgi:hypothetical protein
VCSASNCSLQFSAYSCCWKFMLFKSICSGGAFGSSRRCVRVLFVSWAVPFLRYYQVRARSNI